MRIRPLISGINGNASVYSFASLQGQGTHNARRSDACATVDNRIDRRDNAIQGNAGETEQQTAGNTANAARNSARLDASLSTATAYRSSASADGANPVASSSGTDAQVLAQIKRLAQAYNLGGESSGATLSVAA